tara:strand:- start:42 stop:881 length:840 start_codon:yes stop_codon:yes gene_type:complete
LAFQLFLIKNNAQIYEFETFNNIGIKKSTPVSPMPLPEEDSSENMLMKIEGNTTSLTLTWTLLEGVTPAGSGDITYNAAQKKWLIQTVNPDIDTVFKQLKHIETEIAPNSLNDFYALRFYDTEDAVNFAYEKLGLIQGFNFNTEASSPVNWQCTMDFIEGSVITTLSGNTHEQPTITSKSFVGSPTRTAIQVSFEEFQNYLGGDRPETTGAILRYKKSDGVDFWQEKEITFTANTTAPYNYTNKAFIITGLLPSIDYKIKLSIQTSGGRGEWSAENIVT